MSKKRFNLTMDEELYDKLKDLTWVERKSMTALILQILWEGIDQKEGEAK